MTSPGWALMSFSTRPRHNVNINRQDMSPTTRVDVLTMDWADESTWPPCGSVDMVLGSDLVYQRSICPILSHVASRLLRPGGTFLYVAPETGRDGLNEFISGLPSEAGMELVGKDWAPHSYLSVSPLEGGAEEDFLLHFHELASGESSYRIYQFVKRC